jgi:2-polyprenyl-3-methyl-5-hydroxy-6-metoxy-1,4-benzoquinol methylase
MKNIGETVRNKNRSQYRASNYTDKPSRYFEHVRLDAASLVPENANRVMEIGCGAGNTLPWLKANKGCAWATGVEAFQEAANQARIRLDEVYEGDIEKLELPVEEESFDVVLCLDVLEHMVDPWSMIHRIERFLKPGGTVIASIPNVRHLRVVLPLMVLGRWEYVDEGFLDRTHLRFFTRRSAIELITCSELAVDTVSEIYGRRMYVAANTITLSLLKPFLARQYLIRAVKPSRDG